MSMARSIQNIGASAYARVVDHWVYAVGTGVAGGGVLVAGGFMSEIGCQWWLSGVGGGGGEEDAFSHAYVRRDIQVSSFRLSLGVPTQHRPEN